jgi:hypothetical protein
MRVEYWIRGSAKLGERLGSFDKGEPFKVLNVLNYSHVPVIGDVVVFNCGVSEVVNRAWMLDEEEGAVMLVISKPALVEDLREAFQDG